MTNNILSETIVFGGKYKFYYLTDDKFVGQRIALEKYEPYETQLMIEKIKAGDVVIDIGANIGFDTVLFASKVGPSGKVYAFEPDPVNFSILEKNVKANNIKNVVAINSALGKEEKELFLYQSAENYGDHRLFGDSKNRNKVKVDCTSLDKILKDSGETRQINFIKIDVQGFEPDVIEGGQKTIEQDKPILFFEYWPWGYKKAGQDRIKMIKFLESVYKNIYYVDEYIQILRPANNKWWYKKFPSNKEGIYGNFLATEKQLTFNERIKVFKIKKWIKRLLRMYPLT